MSNITIIDPQISGISGDMLMSALVDAGADKKKIIDSIYKCEKYITGSKIVDAKFEKITVHGFKATRFFFKYQDKTLKRKAIDMYKILSKCAENLNLDPRANSFLLNSLKTLINAESRIHGKPVEKIHLHEASSIDTFVDLIGCSVALENLKIFDSRIVTTHISVGSGLTDFSHGTVANPTNAILEIFRGRSFVLSGNNLGEITTPTGASMLVNLASECVDYYPKFVPIKIGLGNGQKEFHTYPNILRVIIAKDPINSKTNYEDVVLLETNIDDLSGEILGNLIEVIMKEGAKDVTVIPGITKKNRPVHILRIITDRLKINDIAEKIYIESGTSGIRIQDMNRIALFRNIITMPISVKNKTYNVRVKIVKDPYNKIINVKPEYDDLKKIAEASGMSLRKVMNYAICQTMSKFDE